MSPTHLKKQASSRNKDMENLIVEIHNTLKRNKKEFQELKKAVEKDQYNFLHSRPERFSESVSYPKVDSQIEKKYATLDPRKSISPNYKTGQQLQSNSKVTPEQRKNKHEGRDGLGRSPPVNPKKLKTIIFRTLDRLFQLPTNSPNPSIPKQTSTGIRKNREVDEIGIDTLKRLTAREPDTLPRKQILFESSHLSGERDKNGGKQRESKNILQPPEEIQPLLSEDDSTMLSSDEGESWIYVDNILEVQEVTMSDTMENSIPLPPELELECKENIIPIPEPEKKIHYKKNGSKKDSNASKIKRLQERKLVYSSPKPIPENILVPEVTKSKENAVIRQDSPVAGKKNHEVFKRPIKFCVSLSLPNLTEQSFYDSDSSFPECGTESFKRGAILRPSSTLRKEVFQTPTDRDQIEQSFDDGLICSISSSFTSLKTPSEEEEATSVLDKLRNDNFRLSALCKNVHVQPINVPILPIKETQIKIMSEDEFNRRFGVFHKVREGVCAVECEATKPNITTAPEEIRILENEKEEDFIATVQKAFDWLEDADENEYVNSEKQIETSTIVNHNGLFESVNLSNEKDTGNDTISPASVSESTKDSMSQNIPAPPPLPTSAPPPPPLPTSTLTTGTIRGLLPLTVYTQPQKGDNVFKDMKNIELNENEAKLLKEKFPLKKSLRNNFDFSFGQKGKSLSSQKSSKFKLKIEMFLRTWNIQDFSQHLVLKSISTLNLGQCQFDKGCFAALCQFMPNVDASEIDSILKHSANRPDSTDQAAKFVNGLWKIPRLNQKLNCIQFSLDFEDSSEGFLNKITSFIETCTAISTSEKFMNIICVIRTFLECLNSEEQSGKIYGFDILTAYKLANEVSPVDESTTFLGSVIEYILNNPKLQDSIDFHLEFKNLAEATKLSLKDLREQVETWKICLADYKKEMDSLEKEPSVNADKLSFAKNFLSQTKTSLKNLQEKLLISKESFTKCKERYCLSNSDIMETSFFESISKFIISFRKAHDEIVMKDKAKKRRLSMENRRVPVVRKPESMSGNEIQSRRSSCGPAFFRSSIPSSSPSPAVDELDQFLQELKKIDKENPRKRIRSKSKAT